MIDCLLFSWMILGGYEQFLLPSIHDHKPVLPGYDAVYALRPYSHSSMKAQYRLSAK